MTHDHEQRPLSELQSHVAGKYIEAIGDIEELELLGGRLCLDFVNTVESRSDLVTGEPPKGYKEYLMNYEDLVHWGGHVQLLSAEQQTALLQAAARMPEAAHSCFERAIAFRETLCRVFSAIASGGAPAAADLEAVQSAYMETMAQGQLAAATDGAGLAWRWQPPEDSLDQVLWPVVRSAVELLTAPEVARVKVCPGVGDCGWLFLDTSKNGRRRWCSMESCGSRVKMRRYYARTHTGQAEDSGGEHGGDDGKD